MNIIFVSNGLAKAKTLSMLQVSLIALALILLPVLLTLLLIVPQEAVVQKGVKSLTLPHLRFSFNNPQKHLDAYAVQLGERIAQLILVPIAHAHFEIVTEFTETSRGSGGFGHSGKQ